MNLEAFISCLFSSCFQYQRAHIQYCDNVRSACEALCAVREAKTIGNKLFFSKEIFHHQNASGRWHAWAH